jgi:hypothetical protein
MDRRTFLQQSSLMIPGLSLVSMLGTLQRKLFAAVSSPESFSLSVVTDRPEKAIVLIQDLLKHVKLPDKNIRYTEYILHGHHMADVAYTRSGQLISVKTKKRYVPNCVRLLPGWTCPDLARTHFWLIFPVTMVCKNRLASAFLKIIN